MHDLLTSQCDRHAQNVFINDDGQIRLIDNLQVRGIVCVPISTPSTLLLFCTMLADRLWHCGPPIKLPNSRPSALLPRLSSSTG